MQPQYCLLTFRTVSRGQLKRNSSGRSCWRIVINLYSSTATAPSPLWIIKVDVRFMFSWGSGRWALRLNRKRLITSRGDIVSTRAQLSGFSIYGIAIGFYLDPEIMRLFFHLITVGLTFELRRLIFSLRSWICLVVWRCFFEYLIIVWFHSVGRSVWMNQICDYGTAWIEFRFFQLTELSVSHPNVHWIQFEVYVGWIIWKITDF